MIMSCSLVHIAPILTLKRLTSRSFTSHCVREVNGPGFHGSFRSRELQVLAQAQLQEAGTGERKVSGRSESTRRAGDSVVAICAAGVRSWHNMLFWKPVFMKDGQVLC